jgi:hypothetical protein
VTALLSNLQHANQLLGRLLAKHDREEFDCVRSGQEDLAAVLSEILRVGECLAQHDLSVEGPRLDVELSRYRCHLERLRALMPLLHAQLLTERARLEAERSHLESASAWADASKRLAVDHFK